MRYSVFLVLAFTMLFGCCKEPCEPLIKTIDPILWNYLPENTFTELSYRNSSDTILLIKEFEKIDTAWGANRCNGGLEYYHFSFVKNETDKFEIYSGVAGDTNKLIEVNIGPTYPFNAQSNFIMNIDSLTLANETITVDNITYNTVKHFTTSQEPITDIYYHKDSGVVAFKRMNEWFALDK